MSFTYAIQTAVRKDDCETSTQKCVMQALARLSNEVGEVRRSTEMIASVAQTCVRVVKRVLHELADLKKIRILSEYGQLGHYQILGLTQADKKIDSFRLNIADAIRLLPLPKRITRIFQAYAVYASRSGNNIFPAVETIQHDTKYSEQTIRETVRFLLATNMMEEDPDCINGKYQTRTGYKIPGWNALAGTLSISDEQIQQITSLYEQRHRHYYASRHDLEEASEEQLEEDFGDLANTLTEDLEEPQAKESGEDWNDDLAEIFAEDPEESATKEPEEDWRDGLDLAESQVVKLEEDWRGLGDPPSQPAPTLQQQVQICLNSPETLRDQAYSRMQQYQRLLNDPATNDFMRGLSRRGIDTWCEKYDHYNLMTLEQEKEHNHGNLH